MVTLLFKPLLLRVFIMNFQIGSLIFCHSALHMLFGHLFVLYTSQVKSMSFDLSCLIRIYSFCFKRTQIHAVSLRILLSVIFTKNLSVRKSFVDWMKGGWWNWSSQYWTFPLRERSERVGLSACVKHDHVVQSTNCCWPVFGYGHRYP